jgi:hypothetical protein
MDFEPVPMIHTRRTEKTQVKKVTNPRLPQPRPQHLVAILQRLTQVTKSHTVLQAKEEIRTLSPAKLKVVTSFPRAKKKKKKKKKKNNSPRIGGTEGRN